jgi:hypothetical protein
MTGVRSSGWTKRDANQAKATNGLAKISDEAMSVRRGLSWHETGTACWVTLSECHVWGNDYILRSARKRHVGKGVRSRRKQWELGGRKGRLQRRLKYAKVVRRSGDPGNEAR